MNWGMHSQISEFGLLLLSHTNYTLIKFFQAFKKTNIEQVAKTASLANNLISFSRDQLKQSKGLDMQPEEKQMLRDKFNADKHHLVVAMNIIMWLQRHVYLNIDNQGG